MKRILLAGLGLFAFAAVQPALSADQPLPYKAPPAYAPMFNWSGFYLGISGGGIWGETRWSQAPGTTPVTKDSAGIFGGTIGYNWQSGPWVFGVEGDYSWTGLSIGIATCATCTTDLNSLGTVRGRIGWAMGPTGSMLLYLTGGYAFGEVENNIAPAFSNNSTTVSGWTVGGGAEFALVANLTAKVEYLYVALGSSLACTAALCGPPQVNNDFVRASVFRGGLNYKF